MTVYLSLGSNLGDRSSFLQAAVAQLAVLNIGRDIVCSAVYETEPQNVANQPPFLNLCLKMNCPDLSPECLLQKLAVLESAVGRKSLTRFGPREIDIDILLMDNLVRIRPPILPHPRMTQRAFVLVPLIEIAPNLTLPDGIKAADLLPNVSGQGIRVLGPLDEL